MGGPLNADRSRRLLTFESDFGFCFPTSLRHCLMSSVLLIAAASIPV